ncbi:DUF7537 family lipoprotein [Haladaptatus cibarius]|uniref:DUF7537 family lipoprotein n=1 Tax=Haladaptatus cibarius TaxID=453847 RepID=UPI0006786030|nr:hypothetical protein [Haladaptatus cibarius]
MNLRAVFALLTALLLVAGCVGGPAENTGTAAPATETTDITATATETTKSTTSLASLPSGISDDRTLNASRLLSTHESALKTSGYEFDYRSVTKTDGTVNATAMLWGTVAEGQTSFERHTEYTDGSATAYRTHLWANDSVLLTKQTADGQTQYNERAQSEQLRAELAQTGMMTRTLTELLNSGEFTVTKTEDSSGQALITLKATEPANDSEFENATDFDATLVVDSSGRVRQLHRTVKTDDVHLEHDFELTLSGTTAVERPDWSEKAHETVSANIEVNAAERTIELEHAGGETLSAGSTVRIEHDGKVHLLELERSFEPGQHRYLSYPGGGDPVLLTQRTSGANGDRIEGSYSLAILDSNGNTVTSMGFGVGHSEATDSSSDSS